MIKEAKPLTELQLVLFELASEHYAVDSSNVREVMRMQNITRVPGAPPFVKGVINLRGKVMPVLDLGKRLGLPGGEHGKDGRIVVVEVGGQSVGMIVDGVSEVLRIPLSIVEPPSSLVTPDDLNYVIGVAKLENELVILLDLDKLLNVSEKRTLSGGGRGDSQN